MSINNISNDCPPTLGHEEIESPRKRLCLDNLERRSWSLMDRRADQEILQEMGVSLLEPDDNESHSDTTATNMYQHKQSLKRKHDIENLNPNVNLMSPRKSVTKVRRISKTTPDKSSPGPSKMKSPVGSPYIKLTDQHILDTSLEMLLRDEETPLGQSIQPATVYLPSPQPCVSRGSAASTPVAAKHVCTSSKDDENISNRRRSDHIDADTFDILSDEMILSVFRWLPKRTLSHCMLVCKRWHSVASDETLWQRLDLGNKTLSRNALGRILSRKPIILRLASSDIGLWHPDSAIVQSRLQYLDLSMCTIDNKTLNSLLDRCESLKKLSLESLKLDDNTCTLIGKCNSIETLNLTMAQGITEDGLTSILEGCVSLQSLNISWCSLSEECLMVAVSKLPQRLKRLNIGGARIITDELVEKLVERCPRLQELDLSDCPRLGLPTVAAALSLNRLEHLALSRCYRLPAAALTKLNGMPALQYLEIWGMLPNASLSALRSALPAIQINQFMFSAIARPTVGTRRTSIWGLRTRD